jgi:transposase
MQQMFVCPRCGYQNRAGQQLCVNCGAGLSGGGSQQAYSPQQTYSCPICHQPVVYGVGFCNNCRTPLNWPTQQMQPLPTYEKQQQSAPYQYSQLEKTPKKRSPWLIGCLALIGVVVVIGGAIYSLSGGKPATSPLLQTPPVPVLSVAEIKDSAVTVS